MVKTRRVDYRTKLTYGLGSASEGIKNAAFNVFLLFYFNQVLGLSGALAGVALLVALCIDAITDPLIGWISDNTHSRWGRRHPFMYASALPTSLCLYLLFSPPTGLGQMGLFAWLVCFTSGVRCAIKLYQIPSSALAPELTAHYDERTTVLSYRSLFGWVGALGTAGLGYLYFFAPTAEHASGQLDPAAYSPFALTCAVTILATILISTAGTHRLIPTLQRPDSRQRLSARGFARDLRQVLANQSFRMLLTAWVVEAIARGFTDAVGLYMKTYFWGLTTTQMFLVGLGQPPAVLAAFIVAPRLASRSDKRTTALRLTVFSTLFGPLLIFLRLLGLLPENGTTALLLLFATHATILVAAVAGLGIVSWSMLADVVDEGELHTGRRQEALFNGTVAFMVKAALGVGGFLAGIALDLIALPQAIDPGLVPPDKVLALGVAIGPGLFAFYLVTLYFLSRYRISRERYAQIQDELEQRRAGSALVE